MADRPLSMRPPRTGNAGPARKRFGQHFLEPAWVAKVIRAIDPDPDDRFVEIGSGRGALTRPLLEHVRSVLAFEIDRDLAEALGGSDPRLRVLAGDVLDTAPSFDAWGTEPLRVAGNLPYNVASPILFMLRRLYLAGVPIVDATLMLQREVAIKVLRDELTSDPVFLKRFSNEAQFLAKLGHPNVASVHAIRTTPGRSRCRR